MRLESIDDVAWNCVPQTNRPVARQQVNNKGLLSMCWSHHTASTDSRPKTLGIIAGMDQKCSYVEGELGKARRVDVDVSVEHCTATNWDDAGKGVDYLIVLVRDVEVDAESRTPAIVRLPLTPRKKESSRVLHEVLSRQQFHFRSTSKHRVLDRSADPHRRIHQRRDPVLHTDLTGDSTDADCTMRSVASRGVRRVATESRPK